VISVAQADELLARHVSTRTPVPCALSDAHGRILREDLRADRPLPPYDRVAVDGYAFRRDEYRQGVRRFAVAAMQRAGVPALDALHARSCIEVMTGAVLPGGFDAVIKVEDTTREGEVVSFPDGLGFEAYENVHRRGADRVAHDTLVSAGVTLAPTHIGVAASVGKTLLQVAPVVTAAVVATGDELVPVGAVPLDHQIRLSNPYAILAALHGAGLATATFAHAGDSTDALGAVIADALQRDVVILSGGVSMGRFDLVPQMLTAAGVVTHFHKINQKPGKPMLFGSTPSGKLVFGLPGNPVSALVCLVRYVLPALARAAGAAPSERRVTLGAGFKRPKDRTQFAPVRLAPDAAHGMLAQPVSWNGSGDFAALAASDGFVELPAGMSADAATARYFAWSPA
jgi:molybdopterin molybdotransferase